MTPTQGIIKFNKERNLVNYDGAAEYNMLFEELDNEFLEAIRANNEYEQVDALCDIIVVATGALWKLGYEPDLALKQTIKEIHSREGSFSESTGKWMKDTNQDPSTLYKANYNLAKRKKEQ
jgi:hypothetical protein